ncbi:hypothetical protein [uncultured Oxalicibacterium sp.]|nr:hypothetical protein [uncultured Oxalicibacterium sp.]
MEWNLIASFWKTFFLEIKNEREGTKPGFHSTAMWINLWKTIA